MNKNLKRSFITCAALIFALTGIVGCKPSDSTEYPQYDSDLLYEGYDPALRVADTRGLTAQEYSIYNAVAEGDFANHAFGPSGGLKADKNRYVGMFYFMQLGQHDDHKASAGDKYDWQGVYDVSKILEEYGREEGFDGDYAHSPVGKSHWWGESVYGYYASDDEYVMRKQIELLTFAGVDFIYLDVTNGFVYKNITDILFSILKEYRDAGWQVPQVVYYFRGDDRSLLRTTYVTYYKNKPEYADLWFQPEGKPMAVITSETLAGLQVSESAVEKEIRNYFDFRVAAWPDATTSTPIDSFPWMDFNWPQKIFPQTAGEDKGIINVSGSQHATGAVSLTGSWGRGWTHTAPYSWAWPRPQPVGNGSNDSLRFHENLNLQQQWSTVFENDDKIQIVSVTGWNEWAATKSYGPQHFPSQPYYTVDQFNAEYSRDIEPTRTGDMKDNAYLLNTALMRKWKMETSPHYTYPMLSPSGLEDTVWNEAVSYTDFTGENIIRSHPRTDGVGLLTDNTARNDIREVSVARDEKNLYFRIKCAMPITEKAANDTAWMNIHINTKNAFEKDSLGYQFTVNKKVTGGKTEIVVPQSAGADTYKRIGEGDIAVSGNTMFVKIPLAVLGLNDRNYNIEFKVSDNTAQNDILDFYSTGDSAPCGRINWSFGY